MSFLFRKGNLSIMEAFKIIAFKLDNEEYGLNIENVLSIERIQHITRIPNVPPFVKGVMNLRGNVIPVLDLREKLNLGQSKYSESTRVIITKLNDIELGLIVEKTSNVINVVPEAVESAETAGLNNIHFEGIFKFEGHLIILLNLEELMKQLNKEAQQTNN
jgi:purine-binding chemotaxis protein CheW